MAIRKILYPLDLTGSATTNRIENEYVTIGTDKYRAFTLNYAPFYASSLTIKERGKTTLLKAGTDYVVLYYYSELAKLTGGKQICGVVCITNTAIGTDLVVGYNTIGGHYANCASIIEQAIYDLDLDNRETYWQNVIDKPDLFQPTQHLHDIGDVYGLEFIIDCLIGLREAIIIGDNEVHTQIYNRITEAVNEFKSYHATHLANYANPHKVTAHQAGAYTQEEVDALVESLLEDLAALEPRFKVITDNITDVYSKIAAVNGTLASLSDRNGYVEQELSKYVMLLTPINQTLASLQGQIDNINILIAALQAKDVNLQGQINNLVTRAGNIEAENATQDSRLDSLEAAVSTNTDNIGTNTTDIATLKNAVTSAANSATAANDALSKYVLWSSTTKDKWDYANLVGRIVYITPAGSMEIGNGLVFHAAGAPDPAVSLTVDASGTANKSTLNNSGYFNCQDIYVRSDIRDKHDITRISPDTADRILRKLATGIRYKLQEEEVFTAGLSAQEVLKVFPEAVGSCLNEKGEQRFTMRQNAIIGLLVSGYNNHAAIIETLQAKVNAITEG